MSDTNTGGPAFPFPASLYPDGSTHEPGELGMTLRDYFAAQALSGLLAGLDRDARRFMERQAEPVSAMAKACYTMADAMIKAREQQ